MNTDSLISAGAQHLGKEGYVPLWLYNQLQGYGLTIEQIDTKITNRLELMDSDFIGPVNIGSEEMIAINDFAKMAIDISGKAITIKNVDVPQVGVRGRNSDNKLYREHIGWEPSQSLIDGMKKTYEWIKNQVDKNAI